VIKPGNNVSMYVSRSRMSERENGRAERTRVLRVVDGGRVLMCVPNCVIKWSCACQVKFCHNSIKIITSKKSIVGMLFIKEVRYEG